MRGTPTGCETCDEHGVGDLVAVSIVEAADAIERAFLHLAQWRSGRHSDLTEARDVLDALHHAHAEITAAANRLRAELRHVEATAALAQHRHGSPDARAAHHPPHESESS